jgi:predicted deacylase
MTEEDLLPLPPRAVPPPRVAVRLAVPDLRPWREGNTGVQGVWSFIGPAPGPHLAVVALMHGNEIAGAHAMARWLRDGLRPLRGRLSLVFANLDAFARFDPADPTASRFVDEDMNRLWDADRLERDPRRSAELRRARALRPVFDAADVVLDLHSMLWPSDPLILTGAADRARRLAGEIGVPPLVVADEGHATGPRLIDYPRFADPSGTATAMLVEAGPHWEEETAATAEACAARLLRLLGMTRASAAGPGSAASPPPPPRPRFARVSRTVTARSGAFAFVRAFRGGEVVARCNTLIALDGEEEIRTPHDDCLLVMPSPRTMPGHTAVRLARLLEPGTA